MLTHTLQVVATTITITLPSMTTIMITCIYPAIITITITITIMATTTVTAGRY